MPTRKNLRLPGYEYNTPGAYFVTVCTEGKRCILSTIVGADAHIGPPPPHVGADAYIGPHPRLTKTGMVVEKYLRSIPGVGEYVIMPNHVHLMLHISADDPRKGPMWASAPTNVNLSSLVRSWKVLVSKELGHSIWQRSFHERIMRDERDYWTHIQYIRDNPIKWQDDDYYIRPQYPNPTP